MTTTVLDSATAVVTNHPRAEPNGRGTWTIRGLKIFRAGKMKDSRGRQRQWELEHLDRMVQHFNYLRNNRIFVDVPVRADHSISVKDVVGYFEAVRREGNFIASDLELTEQDAAEKWNRRTYRAASLEVGAYETNDEAVYWPAIMGVAFVDIGAVEGLHSRHSSTATSPLETFSQVLVDDEQETTVPTPEEEAAAAKAAADKAAADKAAADKAAADKAAADKAAADKAAADKAAAAQAAADQAAAAKAAADKAAADKAAADKAAQEAATHRAGGVQTFRFGSEDVTDPVEVQRRIDAFNKFQAEQVEAGRKAFVDQLATDNKIAATQKESLTTFALSLTDDQFTQFKAGYDGAAPMTLFNQQGGTGGTPPPAGGGDSRTPEQEKADLEEIVAMHRRSAMPEATLKQTDSYRRLTALDPAGYPA